MPILILGSVVCLFLLFLIFQGWLRYGRKTGAAAAKQLVPVDLNAFENLVDPEEEKFLRLNLAPGEFRSVQRDRIAVARMYVAAISKNASALVSMGQAARNQPERAVAASGQELMQRAIQLKLWCALAALRLNAAIIFPALLSPSSAIASRYVAVKLVAADVLAKMPA